jgi:hypothetical protein
MNSNSNTLTTLVLTDGSTVVLRHRATVVGFANALARKGLAWASVGGTVVDSFAGLGESDRVK